MSEPYLAAVESTDAVLGDILATVDASRYLSRHLTVVLTADHGGTGAGHSARTDPRDYTIPFLVFGAGVTPGSDLYGLNPQLRDPGDGRPGYRGRQPVRNADVANLAASLLGLGPVPGSQVGAKVPLAVSTNPVE
jgi:hypothetical protein